jgi:hypothetical protein
MRIRVNSLSVPVFGLGWEVLPGDKEVARDVVIEMENRRLLFAERQPEDEMYCVKSAIEIRRFLGAQIAKARGKELEQSLRAMRAAALKFVDAAGPDAERFTNGYNGPRVFGLAIGDLRSLMGTQLAAIAAHYDLQVEDGLASIFPPADRDDPSFIPGFE